MYIIGAFDRINYSTLNLILHLLSAIDLHHDFSRIVLESLFPYRIKNDKRLSLEPCCSKRCEAFACLRRRTLSLSFLRSKTLFTLRDRDWLWAKGPRIRFRFSLRERYARTYAFISAAFSRCVCDSAGFRNVRWMATPHTWRYRAPKSVIMHWLFNGCNVDEPRCRGSAMHELFGARVTSSASRRHICATPRNRNTQSRALELFEVPSVCAAWMLLH